MTGGQRAYGRPGEMAATITMLGGDDIGSLGMIRINTEISGENARLAR